MTARLGNTPHLEEALVRNPLRHVMHARWPMAWPQTVEAAIATVEDADVLTAEHSLQ